MIARWRRYLVHWPWALAVLSAIWLLVVGGTLLQSNPPPWPDEALFAAPARDLIAHGHLGTDLMTGVVPGIEDHTYWMPPLYFTLLAGVFAILPITLVVMRAVSLVLGLGALVLTWRLGRQAGLRRELAWLPPVLLALDVTFLRAATLGRMDMLAIVCVLVRCAS